MILHLFHFFRQGLQSLFYAAQALEELVAAGKQCNFNYVKAAVGYLVCTGFKSLQSYATCDDMKKRGKNSKEFVFSTSKG